jgi:hypothetical protein
MFMLNVASDDQGGFFEKPHCVGGHLQGKDGVQCFVRCVASMGIFFRRTAGAPGPPRKTFYIRSFGPSFISLVFL